MGAGRFDRNYPRKSTMKDAIRILAAAGVLAASAAAFAQPRVTRDGDEQFKAVAPGETQQDVRSQLGAPSSTSISHGQTRWTYRYTDTWDMPSAFDVTFDSSGNVVSKSQIRTTY
jgi:outer membrane protein assembly factor BamE (lipoprotein component of BamABCDE complex)